MDIKSNRTTLGANLPVLDQHEGGFVAEKYHQLFFMQLPARKEQELSLIGTTSFSSTASGSSQNLRCAFSQVKSFGLHW